MSANPIKDMYDGDMSPEVKEKFLGIKNFMADKGNTICVSCGSAMLGDTGCYNCPKCGSKDCGS